MEAVSAVLGIVTAAKELIEVAIKIRESVDQVKENKEDYAHTHSITLETFDRLDRATHIEPDHGAPIETREAARTLQREMDTMLKRINAVKAPSGFLKGYFRRDRFSKDIARLQKDLSRTLNLITAESTLRTERDLQSHNVSTRSSLDDISQRIMNIEQSVCYICDMIDPSSSRATRSSSTRSALLRYDHEEGALADNQAAVDGQRQTIDEIRARYMRLRELKPRRQSTDATLVNPQYLSSTPTALVADGKHNIDSDPAKDPILAALSVAKELIQLKTGNTRPGKQDVSDDELFEKDCKFLEALLQLQQVLTQLGSSVDMSYPPQARSTHRSQPKTTEPEEIVTRASLTYVSDWAMVETTTPGTTFRKDPQYSDHVYEDVVMTPTSLKWLKEYGSFHRGRVPFLIINDGSAIDISISHGACGQSGVVDGQASMTFQNRTYVNRDLTGDIYNTKIFVACPVNYCKIRTPANFTCLSDWAEVATTSPNAVFAHDPGIPEGVYRDVAVTDVLVRVGEGYSYRFHARTVPFIIINDGAPIDIEISRGADRARAGDMGGVANVQFMNHTYTNSGGQYTEGGIGNTRAYAACPVNTSAH